jgi:heptosyltransferase II
MKILIELPTWLGDSVMTTPAIENLVKHFSDIEITLLGPKVSIDLLESHPKVFKTYVLEKKSLILYKTTKKLGKFDLFVSFRSSLRSKLMKFCISSKRKYQFDKIKFNKGHQVEKYTQFINTIINKDSIPSELILHSQAKTKDSKIKTLGINPGASYGSAKRWYPDKFAEVACELSSYYDIVILGGNDEKEIAADIEKYLIKEGIKNYINLSNKTSITELVSQIKNLDLFITGDSGPMHIAAAFQIPTVAIFGPTNDIETSQWMNKKSTIVKKNLECQPCMKRSCPLKHHNCMKLIEASDVIEAVKQFS